MSLPFSSLSAHSHSPNSGGEHGALGGKLAAGLAVEVGSPGETRPGWGRGRWAGKEGAVTTV